jgi:hypothetical protein
MKFSANACLSAVMVGDILQISLPSLSKAAERPTPSAGTPPGIAD